LFLSKKKQAVLVQAVDASDNWCIKYSDDIAVIASRLQPGEFCSE
jgi:hypothetical protein